MKDENRKNNIWWPLTLSCMLALGMIIGLKIQGTRITDMVRIVDNTNKTSYVYGGVEEVMRMIETRYIDTIDRVHLQDICIQTLVQQLDPHSVYLDRDRVRKVRDEMQGVIVGMGIEVAIQNDSLLVEHVVSDSPASQAGLKQYDYILAVGDSTISGRTNLDVNYARKLVQGELGDVRNIVYQRRSTVDTTQVTLDHVDVPSVGVHMRMDTSTVYVRIDKFTQNTYRDFMEVMESYHQPNTAMHLILDIRDNPGGFLPQATNILNQFFKEKDQVFVYTEGRNTNRDEYTSTGKPFFTIDKIAVLINENSASGSEVIAGAIQDLDRGVIIGRKSYGKGLIQEQYDLSTGGALRLTVAKYYTASGRSIQRNLENDKAASQDTTAYYTKIHRRTVRGGVGIVPDIEVARSVYDNDTRQLYNIIYASVLSTFARQNSGMTKNILWNIVCRDIEKHGINCEEVDTDTKDYFTEVYIRFKEGKQSMYKHMYKKDTVVLRAMDYIQDRIQLTPEGIKNVGK